MDESALEAEKVEKEAADKAKAEAAAAEEEAKAALTDGSEDTLEEAPTEEEKAE